MGIRRQDRPGYPHPSTDAATVVMKANRSRNTSPEVRLRSMLHASGLRYRIHYKVAWDTSRRVTIDVAFPKLKVAIFVDGCFWHGCVQHRTIPKANRDYWAPKIEGTLARDHEISIALERIGWAVLHVWEHEDVGTACERIRKVIVDKRQYD